MSRSTSYRLLRLELDSQAARLAALEAPARFTERDRAAVLEMVRGFVREELRKLGRAPE